MASVVAVAYTVLCPLGHVWDVVFVKSNIQIVWNVGDTQFPIMRMYFMGV